MYFKSATPESVGIDSEKIEQMINTLNKHNIPMHSLLIARGDKLVCEAYWDPIKANENHGSGPAFSNLHKSEKLIRTTRV